MHKMTMENIFLNTDFYVDKRILPKFPLLFNGVMDSADFAFTPSNK